MGPWEGIFGVLPSAPDLSSQLGCRSGHGKHAGAASYSYSPEREPRGSPGVKFSQLQFFRARQMFVHTLAERSSAR